MRRSSFRPLVIAAVLTAAAVGLTGCGKKSDDGSAAGGSEGASESVAEASSSTAPTTGAPTGGGTDVTAEIEQRGKPEVKVPSPLPTTLTITDDVEGTGAAVTPSDSVTVHYVGVGGESGKEFDSSWSRGQTISFPLSGVIQGWSEGLVGMKVGGRRTLVIPGDKAYGPNPPPGSGIGPNETLVFVVDLAGIG